MRKNGFTFIEILGVITLLALISTIVIITVDKNLKSSKGTIYQSQIESIRSAASMWMADNIELIPDSGYYNITLEELQISGYIKTDIENPKTNEYFDKSMIVSISMNNILVGDETGFDSIDDAMIASVNSKINTIKEKVNTTTSDGVYYFNDSGNLELGSNIIYLDNEKDIFKGNILIHNHQFISGCINYRNNSYDYYKGTTKKQDYPCSTVRGENLVVNGDLSYKNNTNFSSYNYNEDGYLSYNTNKSTVLISDYFMPVDITNKAYEMGVTTKSNNQTSTHYLGFTSYDIDRKEIVPSYVMYISNTLTTLARDLNNGDEYIYLTDMTNWNTATVQTYQRGFIFWNYKDSTGYEYPELTYSRNCWSNIYENSNIDLENKKIKLNNLWNHGNIPSGTKLSQSNSGNNYNYILLQNKTLPNDWTKLSSMVSGIRNTASVSNNEFRFGTSYVRPMFWNNYNNISSVTSDYKDIYFKEIVN